MPAHWPPLGLFLLAFKVGCDALVSGAAEAAGLFSLLFALAAAASAYVFFRARRLPAARTLPPVTILKPLKGLDRGLYENLESFCALDYPNLQLLFTLASPEDPALPVVSRLRQAYPHLDIEIIVSGRRIGFNPKINNVANAQPYVKHDLLLLSDSDIRVQPDFLKRMAAPLERPDVGLVTCFYQSAAPRGLWSGLEALSINAQFLPQAVVAASFGLRFAMGAAMLVRREAFDRAGGFARMAQHLADDFILGQGVQEAGYRLEIADCVVDSVAPSCGAADHLRHQARWARTIRLCNPSGYLGLALVHGFSLLTLKLALFGFDAKAAWLAAGVLAAKALSKTLIAECIGERQDGWSWLLLPLSEWVAFGAWIAGLGSSPVLWRGEAYALQERGRLTPLPAAEERRASLPLAVE